MKTSELRQRFPRLIVLVVGDFTRDLPDVRALRALGARVEAAGLGGEAEREELAALGVDPAGIVESEAAVLEAALDRFGAADAVLFGSGDWKTVRTELFEEERELAVADGRSLRPFLAASDAPEHRAEFTLALAAGATVEEAKKFADRSSGKDRKVGHTDKNHQPGRGATGRAAGASRRKTR